MYSLRERRERNPPKYFDDIFNLSHLVFKLVRGTFGLLSLLFFLLSELLANSKLYFTLGLSLVF